MPSSLPFMTLDSWRAARYKRRMPEIFASQIFRTSICRWNSACSSDAGGLVRGIKAKSAPSSWTANNTVIDSSSRTLPGKIFAHMEAIRRTQFERYEIGSRQHLGGPGYPEAAKLLLDIANSSGSTVAISAAGPSRSNHQFPPDLSPSPSTNQAGRPLSCIPARATRCPRSTNGNNSPSSNNTNNTNNTNNNGRPRPALASAQKLLPPA